MLKLTNVQKNYGSFRLDCSLELLPGRITGLIGPNGAGKTCTYKAILGLIRPDGGRVEIFGREEYPLRRETLENIGVVLAESGFSSYLRPQDVLKIEKQFYRDFDEAGFLRRCSEFAIPMKKQIRDFSTGMKAKLKVIAAVSHRAKLWVLDEPTAGLDVIARDETLAMLRDYMAEDEERGILISSHISGDLESLCDDLYMIIGGSIILHEETDRLLSDYAVLKVSKEEYEALDKTHLLRKQAAPFGWQLLTDQRRYYAERYPSVIQENGGIDDLILMMIKGEEI